MWVYWSTSHWAFVSTNEGTGSNLWYIATVGSWEYVSLGHCAAPRKAQVKYTVCAKNNKKKIYKDERISECKLLNSIIYPFSKVPIPL